MTISDDAAVLAVSGLVPEIHPSAFVAAGARIIGAVTLEEGASVWYNAVLRADGDTITVGANSNVQDNVSVHVDAGRPVVIGENVSIGHNAVVHGCTVEDDVLIGMHATVMNGAVIGTGSIIAAGALVTEGTVIPEHSLVAGVPGKVRRETTEDERHGIARNAETYAKRIELYVTAIGH